MFSCDYNDKFNIMFGIFTNISLLFFIKLIQKSQSDSYGGFQTEKDERFINTSIVWILFTVSLHIILCISKLITTAGDNYIDPLFFVILTDVLIYMFYIPALYIPIKNIYENYEPINECENINKKDLIDVLYD